jgi:hypothetical protein
LLCSRAHVESAVHTHTHTSPTRSHLRARCLQIQVAMTEHTGRDICEPCHASTPPHLTQQMHLMRVNAHRRYAALIAADRHGMSTLTLNTPNVHSSQQLAHADGLELTARTLLPQELTRPVNASVHTVHALRHQHTHTRTHARAVRVRAAR